MIQRNFRRLSRLSRLPSAQLNESSSNALCLTLLASTRSNCCCCLSYSTSTGTNDAADRHHRPFETARPEIFRPSDRVGPRDFRSPHCTLFAMFKQFDIRFLFEWVGMLKWLMAVTVPYYFLRRWFFSFTLDTEERKWQRQALDDALKYDRWSPHIDLSKRIVSK